MSSPSISHVGPSTGNETPVLSTAEPTVQPASVQIASQPLPTTSSQYGQQRSNPDQKRPPPRQPSHPASERPQLYSLQHAQKPSSQQAELHSHQEVHQGPQSPHLIHQPHQAQPLGAMTLGPFAPLPRGRPPRPKHTDPPPGSWHADDTQEWGQFASAAPVVHQEPTQQQQQQQQQQRKPLLEPAYTRGGHLLGDFNTARYSGVGVSQNKFNKEGRLFHLTGPTAVVPWTEQVSYIAANLNCLNELTKRFTSFPNPSHIQLFICETRHATAFRILEASISGPVVSEPLCTTISK